MNATSWKGLGLVVLLAGCVGGDDEVDDQATVDSAAISAPAPAPAPPMGDAEFAHIATTANSLDIDGGNLAKTKAQNAAVKAFANRMATEHTKSNEEATALAQSLGVTPADNATSQQLTSSHQTARAQLEALSGAAFDRAYIDHEVQFHQTVLDALDQQLIPGTQNQQLKDLLTKARAMVNSHLEQARNIQSTLASTTTG